MSTCRIKICGITNEEDARLAAELGADAIGLIFAESPRKVDAETARAVIRSLPPFVTPVAVFVNEPEDSVRSLAERCGFRCVQLHGDESPEYAQCLEELRVIKAVRVQDASSLAGLDAYGVDAFLFDTYSPAVRGGTGRAFNWNLLREAQIRRPVILSGGLRPDNIAEAIQAVRPYAVDVSSGVEASPGKKDPAKLEALFKNIQGTR